MSFVGLKEVRERQIGEALQDDMPSLAAQRMTEWRVLHATRDAEMHDRESTLTSRQKTSILSQRAIEAIQDGMPKVAEAILKKIQELQ